MNSRHGRPWIRTGNRIGVNSPLKNIEKILKRYLKDFSEPARFFAWKNGRLSKAGWPRWGRRQSRSGGFMSATSQNRPMRQRKNALARCAAASEQDLVCSRARVSSRWFTLIRANGVHGVGLHSSHAPEGKRQIACNQVIAPAPACLRGRRGWSAVVFSWKSTHQEKVPAE